MWKAFSIRAAEASTKSILNVNIIRFLETCWNQGTQQWQIMGTVRHPVTFWFEDIFLDFMHVCGSSRDEEALSILIGFGYFQSLGYHALSLFLEWVTCLHELPCQSHGVKLQASPDSGCIQVTSPYPKSLGSDLLWNSEDECHISWYFQEVLE